MFVILLLVWLIGILFWCLLFCCFVDVLVCLLAVCVDLLIWGACLFGWLLTLMCCV